MSQPPAELEPILKEFRANNMAGVLAEAESVLKTQPTFVPALALAGLAALRLERNETAVQHLRAHAALAPEDPAVAANLATALIKLGDDAAALDVVAGATINSLARIEGYIHQEHKNSEAAIAAYRRAVANDPADFHTWNNLANVLASIEAFDEAVEAFENAINLSPDTIEIYLNLAAMLIQADRNEPRLATLQAACQRAPEDPRVLTELGLALGALDRHEEAVEPLAKAVSLYFERGDNTLRDAHIEYGVLLEMLNRVDELNQLVVRCDAAGMKEAELAFLKAWSSRRQGDFAQAALFADQIPDTINPVRTAQLRANIADRMGDTQTAFAEFERMNAIALDIHGPAKSQQNYRSRVEQDTAFWTAERLARLTAVRPASDTPDPVFLVGFPRSGTTLLDTILMADPRLHVMEELAALSRAEGKRSAEKLAELTDDQVAEMRQRYFESVDILAPGRGDRRIVDKHPLSMARIPVIHRLFPKAQIILAERHPVDVVLSCFMANFQLDGAMRSFTTIEEAARTYDAVFSAWENAVEHLPLDTRRVRYERLVRDAESEMRPVIEWLGLDWNSDLLDTEKTARERGRIKTASYSQVTEPIYTFAVERWKRYASQLAPVLPVLEPWVRRMGYSLDT